MDVSGAPKAHQAYQLNAKATSVRLPSSLFGLSASSTRSSITDRTPGRGACSSLPNVRVVRRKEHDARHRDSQVVASKTFLLQAIEDLASSKNILGGYSDPFASDLEAAVVHNFL
jgi:hypothetical protein